jgi:hypothetical protein
MNCNVLNKHSQVKTKSSTLSHMRNLIRLPGTEKQFNLLWAMNR